MIRNASQQFHEIIEEHVEYLSRGVFGIPSTPHI